MSGGIWGGASGEGGIVGTDCTQITLEIVITFYFTVYIVYTTVNSSI